MTELLAFALSHVIYAAIITLLFAKYYNATKRAADWEAAAMAWKANCVQWRRDCLKLEEQLEQLAKYQRTMSILILRQIQRLKKELSP